MSNGKFFRRDNNVDFEQRRQHAQGRDDRQQFQSPRRHLVNPRDQILGHEDRVLACKDIMSGKPGEYPLFDADFTVEQHASGEFMLMKYLGGTDACDLRKGRIRDGYFVGVGTLWGASSNAEYNFRDEDQSFFVKFLLSQGAMQEAIKQLKVEKAKQRNLQVDDVRAKYTNVATVIKPPKAGPPELTRLEQLLTVNYGVYHHASGVDIVVASGPGKRGSVFWAKNPVDGHPLESVAQENIFATVYDVETYPSEQTNPVEGKALLARVFRQWLRQIFREEDLLPPADEQVKDASPASAIGSMASVDAEHAEALGDASTNVVDIHEGGTQPRARTPRKAKA